MRRAVREGKLRRHLSDGGTHRFRSEELVEWAASGGTARLTAKAAAARAGVDYEVLRRATLAGDLDCERTEGGHARYHEAEVDRWAARS
ncbi:MerR family transcriptional regulator [Nocardioides faecalis]|uniref:MerR family transcriptional regulator n=1 Tax=Nocardioides faecalis TaxID=2803858 RepID=UPI0035562F2E